MIVIVVVNAKTQLCSSLVEVAGMEANMLTDSEFGWRRDELRGCIGRMRWDGMEVKPVSFVCASKKSSAICWEGAWSAADVVVS